MLKRNDEWRDDGRPDSGRGDRGQGGGCGARLRPKSSMLVALLAAALAMPAISYQASTAEAAAFPTGQAGGWKFDEIRSNVTPDAVDGAHGTLYGTTKPALATGLMGQALSFAGDNTAYVGIPYKLNPAASSFTLSAWVNAAASGGGSTHLIFQQEGSTGRNWIGLDGTGKFYSYLGGVTTTGTTVASTGIWYHVAVTYDSASQSLKLFVNGAQESARTVVAEAATGAYRVGLSKDNTAAWNGRIDDLKLYGRALSATEIANMAASFDYRGRVKIPQSQLAVSATSQQTGHEIAKAFDGDIATSWVASGTTPQTVTIDLGAAYPLSKIDYLGDPANLQNHVDQYKVYASTDGSNYAPVVMQGNFHWTGYEIRTILNDPKTKIFGYFEPVTARYLKIEMLTVHSATYPNPIASEINVYRDTETQGSAAPVAAPAAYVNPRLSLASQVLIEKGLQIHTWMPSDQYGRAVPTASEFTGTNMTGVTYYDPPLYNQPLQDRLPGIQWNLAKAPYATNAVGQNPPGSGDFLSAAQIADISNAVSFCFGDEQGYSAAETGYLKNWFELSHKLYPRVLVHTNQYQGQWSGAQLDEYMQAAKPDLLTFDTYYWDQGGSIKDYESTLKIVNAINYQRQKALLGIDGTGTRPIAFGQYLGAFKNGGSQAGSGWYESTESEKYLITNLSLAGGMKWLDLFRFEYDHQYAMLFDENGFPTRHYYEYAENFRQARNWGPHLVRLNNVDLRVKPGQHSSGGAATANTAPTGWNTGTFAANAEYHLTDVSAVNAGTQNDGLPGDVVVGYFKPLPGYDTRTFFTSTAPKYFMVVNGLAAGNGQRPENQHGSLADTRQTVTLTFANPTTLKKVNRFTGAIENVALTAIGGGQYTLTLNLGGGEGELFYWDENKSASSMNADLMTLGVEGSALSPAFAASTTNYGVSVSGSSASAKVTAVSADPAATVKVNGQAVDALGEATVTLPAGASVIAVEVTSESGTTKTYQLSVGRAGANLALNKPTTASGAHSAPYAAAKATDGDAGSRWATADGTASAWLEVDLGAVTAFNKTTISQLGQRIGSYKIQYYDGSGWIDAYSGSAPAQAQTDAFPKVAASKVRLQIANVNGTLGPSVYEFGVYLDAALDLDGKTYKIQVKSSGLNMDVSGNSPNDGTAIIQWTATSGLNQQFTLTSLANGYYKVVSKSTGKALAVAGASTADNAGIVQQTYTADASYEDEWSVTDAGSGYSRFINRKSGKSVDMPGSSTTAGTQFVQYAAGGGDNQKLMLVQVV
ncbi:discoidin domain-containing protein [Cohnella sp. GCM10020058]|uniref:discoidin domain-containing protein n=1 Tax=Cohnella sp. GCM10020058 TaxID=3317330 RepID=UPI00363B79EC